MSMLVRTSQPEQPSIYGQANLRSEFFQPKTSSVIGAFVDESFSGVGTLEADIAAHNIEGLERGGAALTKEEYEASPSFRPSIPYYRTLTAESAKALAEYNDEREANGFIINQASGAQTAAGFVSAFAAGIFEPKNLAAGVAVSAVATPLVGAIGPAGGSLRRLYQMKRAMGNYGNKAFLGGAEGMVAAAVLEPSNRDSAKILMQDYTMADTLMNVGLSAALGAGFNVVPSFVRDKWNRHGAKTPNILAAEVDLATSQLAAGNKVDVSPIERAAGVGLAKAPILHRAKVAERFVRGAELPAVRAVGELRSKNLPDDIAAPKKRDLPVYKWRDDLPPKTQRELENPPSWVIRDLLTGEAKAEVFDPDAAKKINTNKYEAVPALEHLANLSGESHIKGQAAIDRAKIVRAVALDGQSLDAVVRKIDAENNTALKADVAKDIAPNASTAIDVEAAKALDDFDEVMSAADKEAAADYEKHLEEISQLKKDGLLTDEEHAEFLDAVSAVNEEDLSSAYDALLACLTRG